MAASKKPTGKTASSQLTDTEGKKQALDAVLSHISKSYGEGAIMKLGENTKMEVNAVSTGSIGLDRALGVGGIPRGRLTEFFGPESSGKTTVALPGVAEGQKRGGNAAFIDAEHALDPAYAKKIGVDINNLLVSQPDYGEQALEIAEALVNSGAVDIIVIDSVAALVPKQEIDGNLSNANVGLHARLMSKAMRMLSGAIAKSNTIVIFINQLREKVGVMFGNPETTTGGRALKFYASGRIEGRKGEPVKSGKEIIGNQVKSKVVKNKVAPPFRVAEFDILYGKGISKAGELIDMGIALGVLKKSGAWINYGDQRIGQGRDNARRTLESDRAHGEEIEEKVRALAADSEAVIEESGEEEDLDEELRDFDFDDGENS